MATQLRRGNLHAIAVWQRNQVARPRSRAELVDVRSISKYCDRHWLGPKLAGAAAATDFRQCDGTATHAARSAGCLGCRCPVGAIDSVPVLFDLSPRQRRHNAPSSMSGHEECSLRLSRYPDHNIAAGVVEHREHVTIRVATGDASCSQQRGEHQAKAAPTPFASIHSGFSRSSRHALGPDWLAQRCCVSFRR